jgi:hypothetical protein
MGATPPPLPSLSEAMRSWKCFPHASRISNLTYNRANSVLIKNAINLNIIHIGLDFGTVPTEWYFVENRTEIYIRMEYSLHELFSSSCVPYVASFSVFSSSCVPYVASFSGLSILDAPLVFSNVYFIVNISSR